MSSVDKLLEINRKHSTLFQQQKVDRETHRRDHPTGVMATGCMDDRVNFSVVTETPLGLVKLQRNIGGKFNLNWHRFQESVQGWNCSERAKGRNRLAIELDHFSRSHRELGCKGFNYDATLAREASFELRKQFDYVYEHEPGFYALNCTVETDEEALIFWGKADGKLDLSEYVSASAPELSARLREVYPNMPMHILIDLLPFGMGNINHITRIRALQRSRDEKDHKAWVVGVGTGLDWILDGAYIINPVDPNFLDAAGTALRLIQDRHKKSDRKPVLLASAAFQLPCKGEEGNQGFPEEVRSGWRLAELKVERLAEQLFEVAHMAVPDFAPQIEYLTTVVNLDTRYATIVG